MSVAGHEVSHAGPDLHRLGRMVTPRWLRQQRRREQSRAARRAVAADVADQIVSRTLPRQELSFDELMRAQGVTPFDAEEHRRRKSLLTSRDWAELRAELAEARQQ
jgi:hypothetical protein